MNKPANKNIEDYIEMEKEDVFNILKLVILYVYGCFAYTHTCVACAWLVPVEAGRRCQIPWNQSYTWA